MLATCCSVERCLNCLPVYAATSTRAVLHGAFSCMSFKVQACSNWQMAQICTFGRKSEFAKTVRVQVLTIQSRCPFAQLCKLLFLTYVARYSFAGDCRGDDSY